MNACFFDVDGTLIDSRADLAATVNHTRRDMGLAELPLEDVIVHVGRGARYLMEHAIPESSGSFDETLACFRRHYAEHMLDTTVLYPGVRETLEELRNRGWRLGINTNKPSFATHAILDHFGLARYFGNAVVAGGDCPELKPSPLTLLECASRMGGHRLSANDWMVGDSWQDLNCAAAAGLESAFCAYGFGTLEGARYTIRINRIEELLRMLKAE